MQPFHVSQAPVMSDARKQHIVQLYSKHRPRCLRNATITRNKSIVESILRTRCALLSPRFRPITHFQWERKSLSGDAAYRKHVREGPSHGHRQHAQKKLVKIARVVLEISSRTDIHRDRQTYSSQYFATAPAGEVQRGNVHRALIGDGRSQFSLPHETRNRELSRMCTEYVGWKF